MLVEREEAHRLSYGFVSTGNFNESTARTIQIIPVYGPRRDIKELNKVFDFFETKPYKIETK